jgi:hypothetical protein
MLPNPLKLGHWGQFPMSRASSRVLEDRRQSRGLSAASGATDRDDSHRSERDMQQVPIFSG